MILISANQLARIERVGQRVTDDPDLRRTCGVQYSKPNVDSCVATDLTHIEMMPDKP